MHSRDRCDRSSEPPDQRHSSGACVSSGCYVLDAEHGDNAPRSKPSLLRSRGYILIVVLSLLGCQRLASSAAHVGIRVAAEL